MQNNALHRSLGLGSLVVFGITYMTVVTVFTTYGHVNQITDGHLPAAYIAAVITMIFTALSYSAMVRLYPVAGSAFSYTKRAFGGGLGFLTGWTMLLDYMFLPMLNFMLIGIYMNTQFPQVPIWVFTLVSLVLVWVLNILGIKMVTRVNMTIIGMSLVMIVVFIALAVKAGLSDPSAPGLLDPFLPGEGGLGPIFAGAGVLALSFLGFDAVSTLSEEAKNPRRDMPRAIVLTTLTGGVLFIIVSWAGGIAYRPDWASLNTAELDAAGVAAMEAVGGQVLTAFFVAIFVAGCVGSGMTGQVSVSRVLFAMGRDRLLPSQLARVWKKRGTPIVATTVVSIVALLGLFIPLEVVLHLVSFGALIAFSMVNLSALKTYMTRRGEGFAGYAVSRVLRYGLVPTIGVVMTLWLWTSLETLAFIVGGSWIALGVIVLAFLTRGFTQKTPDSDMSADTEAIQNMP